MHDQRVLVVPVARRLSPAAQRLLRRYGTVVTHPEDAGIVLALHASLAQLDALERALARRVQGWSER